MFVTAMLPAAGRVTSIQTLETTTGVRATGKYTNKLRLHAQQRLLQQLPSTLVAGARALLTICVWQQPVTPLAETSVLSTPQPELVVKHATQVVILVVEMVGVGRGICAAGAAAK